MGNGGQAMGQRPFTLAHSASFYFGTSFAFDPDGALAGFGTSAGLGTSSTGLAAGAGGAVTPCITLAPVFGLCVAT